MDKAQTPMERQMGGKAHELSGLLIAPDRALAERFSEAAAEAKSFQVLADLKSYPSAHTLEIRLKQIRPDVVLLDLCSNRDAAAEVINFVTRFTPPVQVVGLSPANDSEILLACLRLGASEFLYAPFGAQIQREAVSRLLRLRQPDPVSAPQAGTVVVFSSAKPGAGASTLAIQAAFSLRRITGTRVLLADLDLMGGTVGFYSKLSCQRSLLDALQSAEHLTPSVWSSLVSDLDGMDILGAPESPFTGRIDSGRLNAVLEYARMNYDWVLIDLPVIFQRLSLMVLSNVDRALLVSTSELPSLHLARKAVQVLEQLGFPKERFQILLNRVQRRDEIPRSDMEKLFNCPVHSKFPNDYFSLNRVVAFGHPLDPGCDLGKAVEEFAVQLNGGAGTARKSGAPQPARA